ncbi:MAG TPA: hypothetical protein VGG41_16910 [Solirubrobacteraceae bacterium]
MIESRGRTGRTPSAAEKGSSSSSRGGSGGSRGARANRYDKPPTWKGSVIRAVIAAAIVYALSTLLLGKHSSALGNLLLVPIVLAIYTPMIFYTDTYMFRRRARKKAESPR